MRKTVSFLFLIICIAFAGCVTDSLDDSTPETEGPFLNTSDGTSAESPNTGGQDVDYSGKITAGEWSDLNNWQYWKDLKNNQEFTKELKHWGFQLNHRLSFAVKNKAGLPVIDVKLVLKDGEGTNIWSAKTDNKGKAELWITPFETSTDPSLDNCSVWINGSRINQALKTYEEGVNMVELRSPQTAPNNVEIAFIVDATGSMSDELEFLKDDLKNIIQKVEKSGSNLDISTSSVFYRDEQDEYLVKSSGFTTNIDNTLAFINEQSAAGGGDFPKPCIPR